MPKKHVVTPQAPQPIGPYSQGVISGGLLFAPGQIALDPETGELVAGDVEAPDRAGLKNLMAVLREAKMGPENVVKTTVYLADMADFPQDERGLRPLPRGRSPRRAPPSRPRACRGASRSRSTSIAAF